MHRMHWIPLEFCSKGCLGEGNTKLDDHLKSSCVIPIFLIDKKKKRQNTISYVVSEKDHLNLKFIQ